MENYAPGSSLSSNFHEVPKTQITKMSRRKWEAKVASLDLPSCTHPGDASNCQIYRLDCSTARKVFQPPAGCCVLAHGSAPRRTCNASRNHGWLRGEGRDYDKEMFVTKFMKIKSKTKPETKFWKKDNCAAIKLSRIPPGFPTWHVQEFMN